MTQKKQLNSGVLSKNCTHMPVSCSCVGVTGWGGEWIVSDR